MNHARTWATRIAHEASLYDANSFITLTYADEKLPADQGLSKREFQLFMKRLRSGLDAPIRFFGCGEYGTKTVRPHYHAIIFGEDFARDRYAWSSNKYGDVLYRSPFLEATWGLGWVWIGAVTHRSAGYVAQYALKKAQSYRNGEDFLRLDPATGEVHEVEREFLLMSRRPGIGRGWWDKYASDAFPSDFLVIEGRKVPVPAYYRNLLNESSDGLIPASLDIDRKRRAKAAARSADNTTERRLTKDELVHLRARRLERE